MFFKFHTLIVASAAFAGIANAQVYWDQTVSVSGCGGGGSFTVSDIRYGALSRPVSPISAF